MKITCNQCKTVFDITDENIFSKKASAKCKKCDSRIVVHPPRKEAVGKSVLQVETELNKLKPKPPPTGPLKPKPKSPSLGTFDGTILKGQALGKRPVKIRVQDRNGNSASLFKVCLRYLVIYAPIPFWATMLPFELPATQLHLLVF